MFFEHYNLHNREDIGLSPVTEKLNQEAAEKKQEVIDKFKECFEDIRMPHAFLIFGSLGRGKSRPDSDIDSMLIFDDKDIEKFANDEFLKKLPFDENNWSADQIIDNTDTQDLFDRRLDFLRIKGVSNGEKLELQLFPFSSIKKATSVFGGDLVGGTKRSDQKYEVEEANRSRSTLTFTGKMTNFFKNPRLARSGRRIDIDEVGIKNSPEGWVRGLTAGKLIAPKVVEDTIDFKNYLDNKILKGFIKSVLYNFDFYIRTENNKVIGIKKEALDYRIMNKLLIDHKSAGGEERVYEFGEAEEKDFKERFDIQMAHLIAENKYKVI